MKKYLLAVLVLVSFANIAPAQILANLTNPKITVPIKHPPGLGLKIKRVAFGSSAGECADQLVDMLTEQLVQRGMDVLDRQHLNAILAEQNFTLSDRVDSASALQLGRVLGSAALVFVKIQRCASEKQSLQQTTAGKLILISQTRAYVRGSIQVVDLTTGRIFGAQTLDYSPQRQNKSDAGQPEFPSEIDVKDEALRSASTQSARLLVEWTETKQLVFFDDGACDLKQAANLLKAGNVEAALKEAEFNLTSCKAIGKQGTIAHAYYNVGLLQCLGADYESSFTNLTEAARLRGGGIVNDTLRECQQAKALSAQIQRIESSAVVEAPAAPATSAASGKPATSTPTGSSAGTVEQRLRQLDDLFKKSLISKPEYDSKKAEILKDL